MNNEILDSFKEQKKFKYTERSFKFSVLTITLLFSAFFISFLEAILKSHKESISLIIGLLCFLSFFSGISGFFFSVISFIKKEPNTVKKYIGFIGNILILVIFFAIIFSASNDLVRYYFNKN